MSNKFNLTDNRIKLIEELLASQYSIRYIAVKLGVHEETLSAKMRELKIDHKKIKIDGINTMKAELYEGIKDIDEPDKLAKARLDFLKHYDKSDDVARDEVTVKYGSMDDYYTKESK